MTGLLAARAIDGSLRGGGPGELADYDAVLARVWAAYETHLRAAYAGEARWPDATFWARRREPAVAVATRL